jgi:hypothetical protein
MPAAALIAPRFSRERSFLNMLGAIGNGAGRKPMFEHGNSLLGKRIRRQFPFYYFTHS